MMMETIGLGARLLLGGVFLAAGVGKLLERGGTKETAVEYALLPPRLAHLQRRVLPWLELGIGLLLLLGSFLPASSPLRMLPSLMATGLLTLFVITIAIALARGWEVDCHCFGRFGGGRVTGWTLGRNLALLTLAATGFLGARSDTLSPAQVASSPALTPILVLALAGLAVTAMATEAWRLFAAARRARSPRSTTSRREQGIRRATNA
jgi:uncharacterized membrane protein YphA (DoxX/SURF4 family)